VVDLGIAATALRHWETAGNAWRGFGIQIPDGAGEVAHGPGSDEASINAAIGTATARAVAALREQRTGARRPARD
jgi:hypothetical protein